MKRIVSLTILSTLISAVAVQSSHAAAFMNLDFEDSVFGADSAVSFSEPISLLFPHWTVRFGGYVQTTGTLNFTYLSGYGATLYTSGTSSPSPFVVQGTRTLYLGTWLAGDQTASIAQAGDIPGGIQSLRFVARNPFYSYRQEVPGPFHLQIGGQDVPLVVVSSTDGDIVYGADIRDWAGTASEVRLILQGYDVAGYSGAASIDAIQFSPLPIPEPAVTTLLGACCGILILRRRREGPADQ